MEKEIFKELPACPVETTLTLISDKWKVLMRASAFSVWLCSVCWDWQNRFFQLNSFRKSSGEAALAEPARIVAARVREAALAISFFIMDSPLDVAMRC